MDQASAPSRSRGLTGLRISFRCFKPAYTPEVNPIERFWKHLKTPYSGKPLRISNLYVSEVNTVLSEMTTDVIRSVTGWEFITNAVLSASSN